MHIVYETTNLINDKKYIGVHKLLLSSNYLGSGILLKRAIKKYGKSNFLRKTLIITNKEMAYYYESQLVTPEKVANKMYYNLMTGGLGGCDTRGIDHHWHGRKHSDETKQKMHDSSIGRKLSRETRKRISECRQGNKNPGARPVRCIETGKTYVTILDASLDMGLKSPCSIRRVCQGKYKISCGYHWEYINE